jgi:hypothetical protein
MQQIKPKGQQTSRQCKNCRYFQPTPDRLVQGYCREFGERTTAVDTCASFVEGGASC